MFLLSLVSLLQYSSGPCLEHGAALHSGRGFLHQSIIMTTSTNTPIAQPDVDNSPTKTLFPCDSELCSVGSRNLAAQSLGQFLCKALLNSGPAFSLFSWPPFVHDHAVLSH